MGFLSDREYVIARREYELNGKIYAVSKSIEHDSAPQVRLLKVVLSLFIISYSIKHFVSYFVCAF